MLVALWVLHPGAYDLSALPVLQDRHADAVAMAPALMAASFMILTSVGSAVLRSSDVTGQLITVVITISGQLYIAILIALILGRFHTRPARARALPLSRPHREGHQPSHHGLRTPRGPSFPVGRCLGLPFHPLGDRHR